MSESTNGDEPQPTEEELFPIGYVEGDTVTPQSYIPRGADTEVMVSLMSAEVPNRGGLLKPDQYGRLLVTYLPGKKEDVPQRDGGIAKPKGYKIRQHLRVTHVRDANDVGELLQREFEALLSADREAASKALEAMHDAAAEVLASA